MIKNKKTWVLAILALALAAALTGCMRTYNEPAEPQHTAVPGAEATAMPAQTESAANPTVQDSFDWGARANAVERRIAMFSEIADCRVVVDEETALVGVKFANQYKGRLDQRIKDMVAGEVKAVDTRIQVVAVTAEPGDVAAIFNMSDQIRSGSVKAEDLDDQMEKIIKNTATMR